MQQQRLLPSERKDQLVKYMMSPYPVAHYDWRYSDISSMEQAQSGYSDLWEEDGGKVWNEIPSQAHSSLSEQDTRE